MEGKWFIIYSAVAMVSMFGYLAYSDYARTECVSMYAESNRSAEDIIKICKVK
jgi:hypothetical protein